MLLIVTLLRDEPVSQAAAAKLKARLMREAWRPDFLSKVVVDEIRWDEKAGLRRDAVRSQVIDALEAQEIKETGNEED
jgi:hypothetical protein